MLLLAGFFEEFIGRADAQHFSRVKTVIDGPFDNGRAEPPDDAMLFHSEHKFEPPQCLGQAVTVERLHGVKAHHPRRFSALLQQPAGFNGFRKHVARRQYADPRTFDDWNGLAYCKIFNRPLMNLRLALLSHAEIHGFVLLHGCAKGRTHFPGIARAYDDHVRERTEEGDVLAGVMRGTESGVS